MPRNLYRDDGNDGFEQNMPRYIDNVQSIGRSIDRSNPIQLNLIRLFDFHKSKMAILLERET